MIFFTKLDKHEQVHVCISLAAFARIKQAFWGIAAAGRTQAIAAANLKIKTKKTYGEIIASLKTNQKQYDIDTDNGTKDVEQVEYYKQITTECNSLYPK